MRTIDDILNQLKTENSFEVSANDPTLQFEQDGKQLLFSTVLPERNVEENQYRDWGIRFKTMIANDSTRYSPPTKKNGLIMSSMNVELGDSDIAAEMDQQQYESFIKILQRDVTQQALATVLKFFETSISKPLALLRERHRVQCICDGVVQRRGSNNFAEDVVFPRPAGHRATVPSGTTSAKTGWYDPAQDILATLKTYKRFLAKKGYKITRIITTDEIVSECLITNNGIKAYGLMSVTAPGGSQAFTLQTRSETQAVINAFSAIGLPQPETYDLGYSDENGHQPFMKEKFVMLCETGRSTEVDLGDAQPILLANTLGYYGIGTATGQLSPGVSSKVESFDGKDARIEATGWQTSFPILQDPEALAVLTIPIPTPA